MKEVTLVIPAKKEPNALPIVLNELKNHYPNINIMIVKLFSKLVEDMEMQY